MTDISMTLIGQLNKLGLDMGDGDVIRQAMGMLMQHLIEVEATQKIGAAKHERSEDRTTYRNGYRERPWLTRVGELNLRIPKLRQGSYFPSLLEPRRQAEKALKSVIMTAYVTGTSTRRMDELVRALGLDGIDKSTVSRMCQDLDKIVEPYRNRPLEGRYPYVFLDAVYIKVRQNHRVVNMALVIGIGVRETGEREILGFALGASEEEAFWTEFLRGLVNRGLNGTQLVISDAHEGLKKAIGKVLNGASWQRCRVHFMRNLLAHVSQKDKSMVAAWVRTIFAQPDRVAADKELAEIATRMQPVYPTVAKLLREAQHEVLAYMAFPQSHWTRIYSNNICERVNREVRRRGDVVQIFPDESAVIRLVGTVLMEISDDWMTDPKRYFSQASMNELLAPSGAPRVPGPVVPPR